MLESAVLGHRTLDEGFEESEAESEAEDEGAHEPIRWWP